MGDDTESSGAPEAAPCYAHVAVLLPCLDEAPTVQKVVRDFEAALPSARVYVFDNDSGDNTAQLAREAGAVVVPSLRRGKGHVVRHMFHHVDAEIYVMADGDDTYPADAAPKMLELFSASGADMLVAVRTASFEPGAFRRFHKLGNRFIARTISALFRTRVRDVLSGYRVFSRSLVKSLPLCSDGYSIETELTLQALAKGFALVEMPVEYRKRPEGSHSKLSTWSDGLVVVKALLMLFKDFKPLVFFGWLALLLAGLSLAAGALPILDYMRERYVHHVPLAILAAAIGILATLCLGIGLILDTAARYHRESFMLLQRLIEHRKDDSRES